jgi:ornithine cyclodeaminase/alanine dehydrogenase-like protein (mu-crystallin family)
MGDTIEALEESFRNVIAGEAICRPRIDICIPTSDPAKTYQWGTMEGGSTGGYFAIRMKSDILYRQAYGGVVTQEKYCGRPGLFCGLILLTSTETGEPLAFINDGILQHMRSGADGGIGVKYMANEDAEVVGMLGSGGMARTHMQAFMHVRKIKKLQVFSPTKDNREAFGREMARTYDIEVKVCDRPEDVYKGAHILAALTDSVSAVTDGSLLENGTHIVIVGGGGKPDGESLKRIDVYLHFGKAPTPVGHPEFGVDAGSLVYRARRLAEPDKPIRETGVAKGLKEREISLADLMRGTAKGRTSEDQITYSRRGSLQGAQFYAIASRVYELATKAKRGYEVPVSLFLQDIRN